MADSQTVAAIVGSCTTAILGAVLEAGRRTLRRLDRIEKKVNRLARIDLGTIQRVQELEAIHPLGVIDAHPHARRAARKVRSDEEVDP